MSGFLITCILLHAVGKEGYYKNFYIRRFLRIFPLYYAVLLAMMAIAPMLSASMAEQTQVIRDNAFWFLTYTINWRISYLGDFREISAGYMWSLAVEEQFYLLWPLIVVWCRRHLALVCFSLVLVGVATKITLNLMGVSGTSIYASTLTHMDGLLLGAGLASLYTTNNQSVPEWASRLFKVLALISVFIVAFLVVQNGSGAFYKGLTPVIGVTACCFIFLATLIIALGSKNEGLSFTLFTLRPVIFCGKLCYGLYLLHHPIGVVTEKLLFEKLSAFSPLYAALATSAIAFTLSVTLAFLSFHLFEKHFLKLKRHFETKDDGNSVTTMAGSKAV